MILAFPRLNSVVKIILQHNQGKPDMA
jgi:hypothetical protein